MATGDKNVSPEERLLNVIRGKGGKTDTSAPASPDDEAPPLDEGAPAPAATIRIPSHKPASTGPGTSPSAAAASEPQTVPRAKTVLGDEKIKAALSRKLSDKTRPPADRGPATAPRPAPVAPATSSGALPVDAGRTISKKRDEAVAPGVRYATAGFAAIIIVVVLFTAWEIVAAINQEDMTRPPEVSSENVIPRNPLDAEPRYKLIEMLNEFRKKDMFRLPATTPEGQPLLVQASKWMDTLVKNFKVKGRLGDVNEGGALILKDSRDGRQSFVRLGDGMIVDDVLIKLESVTEGGAIFSDGSKTKELPFP